MPRITLMALLLTGCAHQVEFRDHAVPCLTEAPPAYQKFMVAKRVEEIKDDDGQVLVAPDGSNAEAILTSHDALERYFGGCKDKGSCGYLTRLRQWVDRAWTSCHEVK